MALCWAQMSEGTFSEVAADLFLMTDSICHSSLRRAVLETVALTSIEFCINPRKKVDHVCILVRH